MSNYEIFQKIYETNFWGDGKNDPLSGPGSEASRAAPYVSYVRDTIKNFNIHSVVDFGHGDMTMWENYSFDGVSYIGIEVAKVPHLIASKVKKPNMKFMLDDVLNSKSLPSYELLICKDVLQHLTNDQVVQLLKVFQRCKHLILSNAFEVNFFSRANRLRNSIRTLKTAGAMNLKSSPLLHRHGRNNRDIQMGGFRGLDLEKPPFSKFLTSFELLSVIDFDGPGEDGYKQRIYHFYQK